MLGRGKNKQSATTIIAAGTTVVGDINFKGHLEIEGAVQGNIVASTEADAFVRVLQEGKVDGEIKAPSVVINGSVNGDVFSSKHLVLAEKAQVKGDVHYSVIEMAKGAHVNGSLVFEADAVKKPTNIAPLSELKVTVNS